jgi:TPR repeat protein
MKTNRIIGAMARKGLVLAFSVALFLPGCGAKAEERIEKVGPDIPALKAEAAKGDPDVQCSLGIMFAEGLGAPTNTVSAYMWFNLDAAGARKNAVTNRARLEGQMAPQQISEAKRLSAQFAPRELPPPPDAPW